MTGTPTPMLFTSSDGRHTVSLVVIDGGTEEAFSQRLGAVLRAMRLSTRDAATGRRLTQQQAADIMETDADMIGRWERGQSLPRIDKLARIATAYQVPEAEWHLLLRPPHLPRPVSPLAEVLGERTITMGHPDQLTEEEAALVAGVGVGVGRAARLARQQQQGDAPPRGEDNPDRTDNRGVA